MGPLSAIGPFHFESQYLMNGTTIFFPLAMVPFFALKDLLLYYVINYRVKTETVQK